MSLVHHTDDGPGGFALAALLLVVAAVGGLCLRGVAAWMQARGGSL